MRNGKSRHNHTLSNMPLYFGRLRRYVRISSSNFVPFSASERESARYFPRISGKPTARVVSGSLSVFVAMLFFMAVVRLHHGGMKRARSRSMPQSEALPQAYFERTGERALVGRVLLAIIRSRSLLASLLHTTLETCGSISDWASFSSSLNCLVYGFKSIPCFSFGSRNGDSIA